MRRAQVHLTEAVLLGITGRYPRFIRPPYSATSDAVTPADDRALAKAAGRRYIIALADYDSRDWEKPGIAHIVRNATPPAGRGGVIMLHDGGGNRSQTVAALARIIPALRAQGYSIRAVARHARPHARGGRAGRPVRSNALAATVFLWAVGLAFWLTGALGWSSARSASSSWPASWSSSRSPRSRSAARDHDPRRTSCPPSR